MDEKNIQSLIKEIPSIITPEEVYDLALSKLDALRMVQESKEKPLTVHEIGQNFAYAGFIQGIEYALRNIEPAENQGT